MLSFTIPEGYELTFNENLFNTEKHRLTQADSGWESFYWLDEKAKSVMASFHCHIGGVKVQSPYKATFGGIDFNKDISLKSINEFVSAINNHFLNKSIGSIKIISTPQNYSAEKYILQFQALYDNGFEVNNSEIVAAIEVNEAPFIHQIHKSERKKLKRSKEANLQYEKLEISSFNKIHELINICRKERGINLSMSATDLEKVIRKIPDSFQYYGIYDQQRLIAAAICIRVSNDILYVFYGAHLKEYNKLSPAVLLYEGIYNQCQSDGIKILDFGTSPKEMGTNFNLLDFKQYLGAKIGLKTTFIKFFND